MAAAAITPTVVQKNYRSYTGITGTPVRLVEYHVVLTKATQNDWIVSDTYTPGTVVEVDGFTKDSSSDGVQEAPTYTESGTKIAVLALISTAIFAIVVLASISIFSIAFQ